MINFISKKNFFNKDKLLENLIKESDNKNVIFIKYKGKIYPFKLEITKALKKKQQRIKTTKSFDVF